MLKKIHIGKLGEDLACTFLIKAGYKICQRNYFTKQGELDVVAEKANTIVFVEVKTRKSEKFGLAAEAVTWTKQQHIIKAALTYLQNEGLHSKEIRFDVMEVYLTTENTVKKINHIQAAFGGN